jgi:hypothetical protein
MLTQKLIFGEWMWEKGLWAVGCCIRSHLRRHFFSATPSPFLAASHFPLGWPPPLTPLQQPSNTSSSLDLPPRSKDREEEEQDGLKRKRGSRRCSTPISCRFFLGKTLGKDGILVSPYNYVLLEVVDHVD